LVSGIPVKLTRYFQRLYGSAFGRFFGTRGGSKIEIQTNFNFFSLIRAIRVRNKLSAAQSNFPLNCMMTITWNDFEKVEIRTGTIISVEDFPKAKKPAYKLAVDFGDSIGIKRSSAQITTHYTKEDLLYKMIIAVINFPPKQIADFISECLVLGIYDENYDVILLQPDRAVKNGMKIG
jgi:tRNA-binding protein